MKKRKRLFGVILILMALVIMTLPVSEADAASSASDFVMEGSTLKKYRGTETNVSVPDTVKTIGEGAFEDNTRIELVVLPNSVKKIEAYAFWGCDKLDTVVLGKGLTEVGDYAFAGCKGLEQMSVPASVTSIGIQAFGDCVNMTDITVPEETTFIHESAFAGCAKLTFHCKTGSYADLYAREFYERQKEMPEYEDVPDYDGENGGNSGNGDNSGAETSPAPEPVLTPEPDYSQGQVLGSTQVVANRAFVFVDAGKLPVWEGVQASGAEGREDSERLVETVFALNDSIPKYTIVDGRMVADQAYYKNSGLEEVELPEGITEVGQFSFARSSLSGISLPDGVTDICYGAFYHCDLLAEVALPDSVINVEPKAFDRTAWVERFLGEDQTSDFLVSGGVLVVYRGNSEEVQIPTGVRVIAAEAFLNHSEITSVICPDSLRVVGEGAFENCSSLRKVRLNQGIEQIKDRAFYGTDLESAEIPASVREIGIQAFGAARLTYEGEIPEKSYETSASRLSNESCRELTAEQELPGVTVTGPDGIIADLEGAARRYTLSVREADSASLQAAWERVMAADYPENIRVYNLELTDNSGIPLTKLGRQVLTVTIRLPEELTGQELQVITEDRNGQLETVSASRVLLEGREALQIRTSHLSHFGIFSLGGDEGAQLLEVSVEAAAAPSGNTENVILLVQRLFCVLLLLAGVGLLLTSLGKQRQSEKIK